MKLKVALVLYGQPRFVNLPYSSLAHKWCLRKVEYRVIGHCWFSNESKKMESSSWSGLGEELMFSSHAKSTILNDYQDATIEFEEPLVFGKDSGSVEYRNLVSHLTSLNKALELLKRENEREKFDFVLLSRFDAVILKLPDFSTLARNKLLLTTEHDRFPDFVIAGSVEHVSAIDALSILRTYDPASIPPPAEILKNKAFLSKFSASDIDFINAISKPIRKPGLATSIIALMANLLMVKITQLKSRVTSKFKV